MDKTQRATRREYIIASLWVSAATAPPCHTIEVELEASGTILWKYL
jgi:hypothetical protein